MSISKGLGISRENRNVDINKIGSAKERCTDCYRALFLHEINRYEPRFTALRLGVGRA